MKIITGKYELKGLTIEKLREHFDSLGEPKYRADQVYNWIYFHLVNDFDDMQNLPNSLREKLISEYSLTSLGFIKSQFSKDTAAKKFLFKTHDGKSIESVLIPSDKNRNTLCISTQVGCPLDCKFCATGLMGYQRNLSAGEIVDQYLLTAKEYGKEKITNIVYMGMGEPLLNFQNTLDSLKVFTYDPEKILSRNRITISTAGIPAKIIELAESGIRMKIALSLHSCFDEVRSKIMPINQKYPLEENINALKEYAKKTKNKITFEYTMLRGVNDRKEDIKALIKLCSQLPSKINIIPFNSIKHMNPEGVSAELEPTSQKDIEKFADDLRSNNITVMIRDTQGDDIAAACGQLAAKY